MTPKQIVTELDRYIVGQFNAKKAVAIALRNRYRRSQLSPADREEITPKNIIMKGPTGVGKTEIARRLAKLVKAPFLKAEGVRACRYNPRIQTLLCYYDKGRIGVEVSIRLVKDERYKEVESRAYGIAVERVADALLKKGTDLPEGINKSTLKDEIAKHNLDQMTVEIQVADIPKPVELQAGGGEINLGSIFGDMLPKKTKKRVVTVAEALKLFASEESEKLIDLDSVESEALRRAENDGVIFIDEMDKIAGKSSGRNGPDVSREGVQRDILPIVEGCTVSTKYGNIKTDYILFIASGAFHVSKVSDLIPELQGRFPVLVELDSLGVEDFVKILTVPANAITDQYKKLLAVDNIDLGFTDDGIRAIAEVAFEQNNTLEDIGARRLQSIMEHIVEDISYDVETEGECRKVVIDRKYVEGNFTTESRNLKKYVL